MFKIAIVLVLLAAFSECRVQHEDLTFREGNKEYTEKFFADSNGKYEIIKVPAHGDRLSLAIFDDFAKGYRIHKVAEKKTCNVMKLDKKSEGSPAEQLAGVKAVHGHFNEDSYMVSHEKMFVTGPVNLESPIGKTALRFCGSGYQVNHAIAHVGQAEAFFKRLVARALNASSDPTFDEEVADELAVNAFTEGFTELLEAAKAVKPMTNDQDKNEVDLLDELSVPEKRANIHVLDFVYQCPNDGRHVYKAMEEMAKCNFDVSRMTTHCSFVYNTCVWRVRCNYVRVGSTARIECQNPRPKSEHKYTQPFICCYKCPVQG